MFSNKLDLKQEISFYFELKNVCLSVYCLKSYQSAPLSVFCRSACLSACLCIYQSVCTVFHLSSVRLPICLSVLFSICLLAHCLSACRFIFPSVYLSGHLSFLWLPILLSVHVSVCLCSHPFVLLPVCSSLSVLCLDALPICLFIYPSVCLLSSHLSSV